MFYLIGLGLFDIDDMSIKALNALREVDVIYAEFFTSKLIGSTLDAIENRINSKINILNRSEVEEDSSFIDEAKDKNVALITGGDPLIATTHSEFIVQCKKKNIDYKIIHGSSILSSAPAISGLQGYKFGKVTTIPFPDHNFFPKSPYEAIVENLNNDMHTLVLLDIQAHNDRYMTVNQGLKYLIKVKNSMDKEYQLITEDTLAIGIARVGSNDNIVKAGKISDLIDYDFGSPLHSIVIPSKLHIVEAEYLVYVAGADKSILDEC